MSATKQEEYEYFRLHNQTEEEILFYIEEESYPDEEED